MSLTVEKSQEVKEQLFEVRVSKHGVFTLIKEDDVKIAIKNQIVTDKRFTTFEEAEAYIESKPYELLLISSYLYGKHIDEQMQLIQSIKNNN